MWRYKYKLPHRYQQEELNIMLNSFNLYSMLHFPTRIKNGSSTMIDNIFFDTPQFNNVIVSLILKGLSDNDTQLLLLQDLNYDTKNNYNITTIRKIDNSLMVEFKIRLSYELWDNVFSADNKDVDSICNTFLNTYLQIFYSCFPEKKL
jgi:hypothetical protein